MRKRIVAGNWKMNKTVAEARDLVKQILRELGDAPHVDIVLCPPFTALGVVSEAITDSVLDLGSQNMHWEASGAYTGETSAEMLRELFCHYVILGHSERRTYFHETDDMVNHKARAARAANLIPIVCVGETLEQREAGDTDSVVAAQVRGSLRDLSQSEIQPVIVAYEPIWAIGTGRTASPEQAQEVHALIRGVLAELADDSVADAMRIQYGGSVKPDNAVELFNQPDIDGGLIGGASLDARSFAEIVRAGVRN
jgi:triosephosphate isomerase